MKGLGVDFPVPVEVAPAFHQRTLRRLAKLTGADARLRLGLAPAGRPGADVSGKPFVTDNGNYVVDLFFREPLGDVWLMASSLDACPGAVEHGLFPSVDAGRTIRRCWLGGGWGRGAAGIARGLVFSCRLVDGVWARAIASRPP